VGSATTHDTNIIDQFVYDEIEVSGRISGSFLDTHVNNGITQSITEVETRGKPTERYSYLEHKWLINVQPGESVIFYANTWAPVSTDGDTFIFAYSPDDVNYVDMFTTTANSDGDNYQTYSLPSSTSSTVYIRVVDTDRTPGNRSPDTIFVDHLYIQTKSVLSGPPEAPTGLTATPVSASQIDLSWTDNANNESGFDIERSPDGINWQLINTVSADSTVHSDMNLAPNTTYYYRVRAINFSGVSGYSNTTNATTPQATIIHVGNLEGLSTPGNKNRWDARVTITIHDSNENPVVDETVSVTWSGGVSGSDTCSTDSAGQCTVTKTNIKNKVSSVTLSVTNVTGNSSIYQPADNHDPDGDSDGTTITIVKP
jgi:hypothetical protein